jgi:prepilin-type N-terminal cleavage/methylation domain-containing protein
MYLDTEEKFVDPRNYKLVTKSKGWKAFTLFELLVVMSIISLLAGILLPALGKVRRQAKTLMGMNNQRQIVLVVNRFAMDNDDGYPESMATTTEFGSDTWYWQEPTMMTACYPRPSLAHRSISAYLHSYIEDASILFCPSAPEKYKYLQQAWDAGDDWNNPESTFPRDLVSGTYCFYWNYIGFLEDGKPPFRGPRNSAAGRGESKLLVSDYFGFGHWRNDNTYGSVEAYGSCEEFNGAGITAGTEFSSAFWSRLESDGNISLDTLKIKLHAGYTDGHVESYLPSETVPMRVSTVPDGSVPYTSGAKGDPGVFYWPRNGIR